MKAGRASFTFSMLPSFSLTVPAAISLVVPCTRPLCTATRTPAMLMLPVCAPNAFASPSSTCCTVTFVTLPSLLISIALAVTPLTAMSPD